MRRAIWIALALAGLLLLYCAAAQAETYDLYVAGVQVTTSNQNDILGDGGKAVFDPATSTLTLNNPDIRVSGQFSFGIRSLLDDLTITGSWTTGIPSGINAQKTLRLAGDFAMLQPRVGIYAKHLFIQSGSLVISQATASAIAYGGEAITIGADVTGVDLSCRNNNVITNLGALFLEGNIGVSPDTTDYHAIIGPGYTGGSICNLWVDGIRVRSSNQDDILGDGGKAQYDPANHTLALNDPDIMVDSVWGIESQIDDLTVTGSWTTGIRYGIRSANTLRLAGDFILNQPQLGIKAPCLFIQSGTLEINQASISAICSGCSTMTVGGGVTRVDMSCDTTILTEIDSLILEGNIDYSPATTDYHVILGPGYTGYYISDLWVGGIRVRSSNQDDILGDGGKAQYDPANHTLALNDPDIMVDSVWGIESQIDDLTVTGSWTTGIRYGIRSANTLRLAGDFVLNQPQLGIDAPCLFIQSGNLEINRASISAICSGCSSMTVGGGVTRVDLSCDTTILSKIGSLILEGDIDYSPSTTDYHVILGPGYTGYGVYDLWVGGQRVISANQDDVLNDGGKVQYDPTTHTLTLNDPDITVDESHEIWGIESHLADLTIAGSWTTGVRYGIKSTDTLCLAGDFVLNQPQLGIDAPCLFIQSGNLEINRASISAICSGCSSMTVGAGVSSVRLSLSHTYYYVLNDIWSVVLEGNIGISPASTDYNIIFGPGYTGYYVSDLWVGGIRVRSSNQDDILGDGGKAQYDPAAHTLTLNDPDITVDENHEIWGIESRLDDLTVAGSWTTGVRYGIKSTDTLRLAGDFILNQPQLGIDAPCLFIQSGNLEINRASISAICSGCSSMTVGAGVSSVRLSLSHTYFYLLNDIWSVVLEGNIGISPASTDYNIIFGPGYTGYYVSDLWVGGTRVRSSNQDDILGDGGKAQYDPATHTLMLNDPDITVDPNHVIWGIESRLDDLTVAGSWTTGVRFGIKSTNTLRLAGDFVLNQPQLGVKAPRLFIQSGTLEINQASLAPVDDCSVMTVRADVLSVKMSSAYNILANIGSLVMEGTLGLSPSSTGKDILIAPGYKTYDIYLGSTAVTYVNHQDIFGDGKASYNPDTGVLTLNNPDISGSVRDADGNKIKILSRGAPLTIRGSYSMTETDIDFGLVAQDGTLTLDGSFVFRGTGVAVYAGQGMMVSGGNIAAFGGDTAGVLVGSGSLTLAGGSFSAYSDNRGVHIEQGKLILLPGVETTMFQGINYAAIVAMQGISLPSSGDAQVRLTYPGRGYIGPQTVYDPDYVPTDAGPVYVSISTGGDYPAHTVQFASNQLYGLVLGKVMVTSDNARDILGDGKASYDPITHTLTLNEPTISGSVMSSYNGFAASYTIYAEGIDQLTVKGRWHMAQVQDDYAIQVCGGSLVLEGSFAFKGNIAGVSAYDRIVLRSGGLYAYGGEVGAVAGSLIVESGCGYAELESGSNEPIILGEDWSLPDAYGTSLFLYSFRTDQAVNTAHYQFGAEEVITIRRFNITDFSYSPVSVVRLSDFIGFEGAGTEDDPYQVRNTDDWNLLANILENGRDLSGKHFGLMNSLTVTAMIGSSDHPFNGIFDGCGNTLTFNYTAAEEACAPFRYTEAATIKNLRTAGTISTSAKFAAGVAARASATRIVNCTSDVKIVSTVSGDGTHGGFAGVAENTAIIGCTFTGSITGVNTTKCGGFIGWNSGGSTVSCCVYNGIMVTGGECGTFIRNTGAADRCYYTEPIGQGKDYGKKMYSVFSSQPSAIILDFGGGIVYSVSGITAYSGGLKWNGSFRAGSGDTVTLSFRFGNMNGARIAGAITDAAQVTAAGEDAWTFTMPAEDVPFRPKLVPLHGMGTEESPWQIQKTFWIPDLYDGWYKVAENNSSRGLTVHGDVRLVLGEGKTLTVERGIFVPGSCSLAISGTGTIAASGYNGGPAIGGDGTITFADGLMVQEDGAQRPANAENRAAACGQSVVTVGSCAYEDNFVFTQAGHMNCAYCAAAVPVSGSGTSSDPYTIGSTEEWNRYASAVANGFSTEGKHFALIDNISVTAMMGTVNNPFAGTFDGRMHTLTFTAVNTDNDVRVAPFAYISGATIRKLHATGEITGAGNRASGLIGENSTTAVSQVVDCRVSTSLSGRLLISGFCIGSGKGVSFTGCLFDGSISSTGQCGAFVAWANQGTRLTFLNCMAAPSGTSCTGVGGTFYYDSSDSLTPSMYNCLYLSPICDPQGKQGYSVTPADGLTLDWGQVTHYSVSGLRAYGSGLWLKGVLWAGEGDLVRFTPYYNVPEGYFLIGYACTDGDLVQSGSAWFLTMPAGNVTVSALIAPVFGTPDFTLPAGLTEIDAEAFAGAVMTAVDIPASCSFIGDRAFAGCTALTKIRIPAGCDLGEDVFDGCTLVYVYGTVGSSAEAYCASHANCTFADVTLPAD